jgi:hypothetical protein
MPFITTSSSFVDTRNPSIEIGGDPLGTHGDNG